MLLGLLCFSVFPHLHGILNGPRTVHWRSHKWQKVSLVVAIKGTSAPRWEDACWFTIEASHTEPRGDFLASPGECRGREWTDEEWLEYTTLHCHCQRAHRSTRRRKGVMEDECKSLPCLVHSLHTTSPFWECFCWVKKVFTLFTTNVHKRKNMLWVTQSIRHQFSFTWCHLKFSKVLRWEHCRDVLLFF